MLQSLPLVGQDAHDTNPKAHHPFPLSCFVLSRTKSRRDSRCLSVGDIGRNPLDAVADPVATLYRPKTEKGLHRHRGRRRGDQERRRRGRRRHRGQGGDVRGHFSEGSPSNGIVGAHSEREQGGGRERAQGEVAGGSPDAMAVSTERQQ